MDVSSLAHARPTRAPLTLSTVCYLLWVGAYCLLHMYIRNYLMQRTKIKMFFKEEVLLSFYFDNVCSLLTADIT